MASVRTRLMRRVARRMAFMHDRYTWRWVSPGDAHMRWLHTDFSHSLDSLSVAFRQLGRAMDRAPAFDPIRLTGTFIINEERDMALEIKRSASRPTLRTALMRRALDEMRPLEVSSGHAWRSMDVSTHSPELTGRRYSVNTDNEIRCGLYEASEQQAIEYNAKLQFRKRYGFPPERTVWLNHPDHYDMVRKRLDHERMDPLFGTEAYMVDFRDLYLLKRPVWIKKVDGNKHADDGPAVLYANGAREYWHNGRAVDPWVVKRPHRVTMRHIKKENNSELKRIFIEKYIEARGHPLFLKRMGARLLHEDEVGKLWGVGRSTSSRNGMFDPFELRTLAVDEVVGRRRRSNTVYEYTMAEVVNSTAEPDGTFKTYYLTTPGNMRTCREAVAWTFALSEDQYKPLVQT